MKVKRYLYLITDSVEKSVRLHALAGHLALDSHPGTHYIKHLISHKIKCFNPASGNRNLAIHLTAKYITD